MQTSESSESGQGAVARPLSEAEPTTTPGRGGPVLGAVVANPVWHCAGLAVLALALRFWGIASQSLWLDETLHFNLSRMPLMDMVRAVIGGADNSPPLYVAILHYVISWIGTNELALRAPSALFGAVSVVLVYLIARQLADTRTALVAGLLMAVSPLHVWYSQEARMYSLMAMLVLGSTLVLVSAARPPALRSWLVYVLLAVMGLYAHLYAVLSLVGQGCWLALDPELRRTTLKRWLVAQAVVMAFILPWLAVFSQAPDRVAGFEKSVNPLVSLGYTFITFLAGYSVGPSVAQLHLDRSMAALRPHLPLLALYAVTGALVLVLGFLQWRRQRRLLSLALCMAALPIAGALTISEVTSAVTYNVRYALGALPFVLIWFASGLAARRSNPRTLLLVALLVLAGISLWRGHALPEYFKEDNRSAASYVAAAGQPGDGVVLECSVPFEHYFPRSDLVLYELSHGVSKADRAGRAAQWAKRHRVIWLVECRSWTVDPEGVVPAALAQIRQPQRSRDFPGVRVTCYGERTGP
jgi:mannosyltransferase